MTRFLNVIMYLVFFILISGCPEDKNPTGPQFTAISEDHSTIADPLERWQAYGLEDYVIEQQVSCFCIFGGREFQVYVAGNKISKIIEIESGSPIDSTLWGFYKTIDELFEIIESIEGDSVYNSQVEYDARFGFPSLISLDYNQHIADDEIAYITKNLLQLAR
ncbi:MAG: hypothetical protein DWQ05_06850 [Calditrichaeota bacterium]|nr:MAG: hypothetical protein DWQ05_06850 [Calditrichota bacterium]